MGPCKMMHLDRLIKIIHIYCPKLIIATKYKPNMSMQTAQLRALIQYMLMVKRAKKRLQWAGSMERGGGSIAVLLHKAARLRRHGEGEDGHRAAWSEAEKSQNRDLLLPCLPDRLLKMEEREQMLKYQGKKGKEQGCLKKQRLRLWGWWGCVPQGRRWGRGWGCAQGCGKEGECSGRSCRNTGNHPEGLRSLPQIGVSFLGVP